MNEKQALLAYFVYLIHVHPPENAAIHVFEP
jgi:hypothetical protein